jgi:hypothetical protein
VLAVTMPSEKHAREKRRMPCEYFTVVLFFCLLLIVKKNPSLNI